MHQWRAIGAIELMETTEDHITSCYLAYRLLYPAVSWMESSGGNYHSRAAMRGLEWAGVLLKGV